MIKDTKYLECKATTTFELGCTIINMIKKTTKALKGLFHPAFLARVISWLAFVRRHFRGP